MSSLLVWDVMQHRLVVRYWCFGTTCPFHLQGSGSPVRLTCPGETNRLSWNVSI